ncbi:MAG: 50S ribosomal protein L13 [Candidatus Pacebacteria bacterium]|nr:50S ribosomal protein L13 [Candidatus Paceibacterota bacterium]
MEYKLDAKEKRLGRLASQAAILLMGKDRADFQKNIAVDVQVKIKNISRLDISKKKMAQKEYSRYSGYPGGRKTEKMEKTIQKKGCAEVFKKAVRGMLPANKLRAKIMKNLIITE